MGKGKEWVLGAVGSCLRRNDGRGAQEWRKRCAGMAEE